MNQANGISLAQQGSDRVQPKARSPQEIASLLHQAFKSRGIRVQVVGNQKQLHILLEAESTPSKAVYVPLIQLGLKRLQIASIDSVQVYGRQRGQKRSEWKVGFNLEKPSVSTSTPLTASSETVAVAQKKRDQKLPPSSQQATKVQVSSSQFSFHSTKNKLLLLSLSGVSFLLGSGWDVFQNSHASSRAAILSTFRDPFNAASSSTTTSPNSPSTLPTEAPSIDTPTPAPESITNQTTIKIKAVGDMIPGTNFPNYRLPSQKEGLFAEVKGYFYGADILFGNFESTLTNYPYSAKDTSRSAVFAFRTPPEYATLFQEVGFDVLSVANNHSMDFTNQGFEDTINNIENAGMKAVGEKGEIVYQTVKGVDIAYIGFSTYSYHNSILDLEAAKALVEEAKENANIVVISIHGGAEGTGALHVRDRTEYFYGENRGNLVQFSHAMIDAGADLILGHGPHVPRAIELYKDKLIAYSLGNFVGYRSLSTVAELAYSLILEVDMDSEGNFVKGRIIPVYIEGEGIPTIDHSFRSVGLIRRLTESDFPDTPLTIERNGEILKKEAESDSFISSPNEPFID